MATDGNVSPAAAISADSVRSGRSLSYRSRRVMVLLIGIVALSLADLTLTAGHLLTTGMFEANPIAAWVIRSTESIWVLSLFKLVMMSVCVVLLYRVRRHPAGEIGAWTAAIILSLVCLQWHRYSREFDGLDDLRLVRAAAGSDEWLSVGVEIQHRD